METGGRILALPGDEGLARGLQIHPAHGSVHRCESALQVRLHWDRGRLGGTPERAEVTLVVLGEFPDALPSVARSRGLFELPAEGEEALLSPLGYETPAVPAVLQTLRTQGATAVLIATRLHLEGGSVLTAPWSAVALR